MPNESSSVVHENQDISSNSRSETEDAKGYVMDEQHDDEEKTLLNNAELHRAEGNARKLTELLKNSKSFFNLINKAKAAKLVKKLVDYMLEVESDTEVEVNICKEYVEWARENRSIFLCQYLEVRLVGLYHNTKKYNEALALSEHLLKELKRMEEKRLLVEVLLEVSKIYYAMENIGKAVASLTSARATSNTIYCPPNLQAALDLQSGILHAANGQDFKTAFSYFYEAFSAYDNMESPKALTALKYMMLCKIMLDKPDDIRHIINNELMIKYTGRDIEAMSAVAQVICKRSHANFVNILENYSAEFEGDPIIKTHLDAMKDKMLEQNLLVVVEPYSKVQIQYIADKVNISTTDVEKKLSQMILDKKLFGILDNRQEVLLLFDKTEAEKLYKTGTESIHRMGDIVDNLYRKAKCLH